MTKIKALAKHLQVELDDLIEEDDDRFSYGREEYLILDDTEADKQTEEYISDSLWAFRVEFL